ncbi:MAG: hypothetical protein VYE22_16855, partial [Myxococcota bacterium]|nr:hypothetical protein [Myxococcota bacterium]
PRAVRNAIAYVLGNARRHGVAPDDPTWVDPLSSGYFFDGWTRAVRTTSTILPSRASPAERAETWLLSVGWRRAGGRIDPGRRPGPAARPHSSLPRAQSSFHSASRQLTWSG